MGGFASIVSHHYPERTSDMVHFGPMSTASTPELEAQPVTATVSPSIKQAPISCPGHSRPVVDLYFSAESDCGSLFISAAKDGRAILRQGDTGDWIGTFIGHQGAVWSCALDYHATKAATGAADFTAKLWDTGSGQELLSIAEDHIVRCVDLSKTDSGAFLLTANNRKELSVYDLNNATCPVTRVVAHTEIIRRALWCDMDRHMLTASEDATIKLWDLQSSKDRPVLTSPSVCLPLTDPVTDLQFLHPTGDQANEILMALSCGRTVHLFSFDWRTPSHLLTDSPTTSFTLPGQINSVSLHPTENIIVCGGDDHNVYRVDRGNGDILETCKGHFGPVHCVRFSPGGQLFATGSEDGTVRLWQSDVRMTYGLWRLQAPLRADPNSNDVTTSGTIEDAGLVLPCTNTSPCSVR